MRDPLPTPQTDEQWATLLQHYETLARVEADAEVRRNSDVMDSQTATIQTRALNYRYSIIAGAAVAFALIVWGAIIVSERSDGARDLETSRICITTGGTWVDRGLDGYTCTPAIK